MAKCLLENNNTLHLMVQDPNTLFVYWHISADYLQMATKELQSIHPGLHLRLVEEEYRGSSVSASYQFPQRQYHGSAYFHGQRPFRTYHAELGLTYHGGFFAVLRSETALTPPAGRPGHQPDKDTELPALLPFAYSPPEQMRGRGE
ncbi:MAG: DUF4912 domain-containing protein [Bacillota bacterium]|nr:DUF4912 domain-containing protein [Bacillota bacterium]MDW7683605.1 DUF4912 domain-containing protein [Bacillota bacterium]